MNNNNSINDKQMFYSMVYLLLIKKAEASDIYFFDFVTSHIECEYQREFRFQGKFGFGGKYRKETNSIDYYPEDHTKELDKLCEEINEDLKKLYEDFNDHAGLDIIE